MKSEKPGFIRLLTGFLLVICVAVTLVSGCRILDFGDNESSATETGSTLSGRVVQSCVPVAAQRGSDRPVPLAADVTGFVGIAGAEVWLEDLASDPRFRTVTNASGTYLFTSVPPGEHRVIVQFVDQASGKTMKARSGGLQVTDALALVEAPDLAGEPALNVVIGQLRDAEGTFLPEGTMLTLWGEAFLVGKDGTFTSPALPESATEGEILVKLPGGNTTIGFTAPFVSNIVPAFIELKLGAGENGNHAPAVVVSARASGKSVSKVNPGTVVTLVAVGSDSDSGDQAALVPTWSATSGTLADGASAFEKHWTAPNFFAVATITVEVKDPKNATGKAQLPILVGIDSPSQVDTGRPTVVLAADKASVINSAAIHLTITFDEPVNGFELADISVTNATLSDFSPVTTSRVFEVKVTPQAAGEVKASIAENVAVDLSNNKNTASNILTFTNSIQSSEKAIVAFGFPELSVTGTINNTDNTIAVTVPCGTNVTALVARFNASAKTTVNVGDTPQVSGTTANDFSSAVVYKVTAEDGTSANYTVTVSVTQPTQITAMGSMSGTPQSGQILTAGALVPNGATVDYKWQVSNDGLATWDDIPNATGSTYAVDLAKTALGKYVRVVATGKASFIGTVTSAPVKIFEVSATVADVTVDGMLNQAITAREIAITLANDTIASEIAANADLAVWVTNLPAGLTAKAKSTVSAGATAVTIEIAGTPTETKSEALTISIPAANLTVRTTDLAVTANANAKFAVVEATATVGDSMVVGMINQAITAREVVICLHSDTIVSEIAANADLAAWVTNLPAGLTAKAKSTVSAGATAVTIEIAGTPTETKSEALTISIPAANLTVRTTDLAVTANTNAKFAVVEATATVGDVTVGGLINQAITAREIVITFDNDTIASEIAANADLAAWITNLPAGLTAKAKSTVSAGATVLTIEIAGTPTVTKLEALTISIPAEILTVRTTDLAVTANDNAKFAVDLPPGTKITHTAAYVDFKVSYAPAATFPRAVAPYFTPKTVLKPFWIGEKEVTYELWYAVRQWATFNGGYTIQNAGMEGSVTGGGSSPNYTNVGKPPTAAQNEPVTMVRWRDAIVWCNALSEMLGKDPVYRTVGGDIIRSSAEANASVVDAAVATANNGFRLPTEWEWELAARWKNDTSVTDGSILQDGRYWTPGNYVSGATADYNNALATELAAWYNTNSGGKTQEVGQKPAGGNHLGLYDMSGNVCELCWDINDYGYHVLRGGGYNRPANMITTGYRDAVESYYAYDYIGFRVVHP